MLTIPSLLVAACVPARARGAILDRGAERSSSSLTAALLCAILLPGAPLRAQRPATPPAPYPASPSPGSYHPPVLSWVRAIEDPATAAAVMQVYKPDGLALYQSDLRRLATSGNPAAALILGEQYLPRERFAASSAPGQPALEPDPTPPKPGLASPSFAEAIRWLQIASAAGSGEASEDIAQAIPRMLALGEPTTLTVADATRFRHLAVQQGYDLEAVEAHCVYLERSPAPLTCSLDPLTCPSAQEMQVLRNQGLTGTLIPLGGASGGGSTTATMHPANPAAHLLLVLDHDVTREERLPIPRHASAIVIQQKDGWLTLPANLPAVGRDLVLLPGPDAKNSTMAYVQNIDGSFSGGYCLSSELITRLSHRQQK